jgi:hypothetical protein
MHLGQDVLHDFPASVRREWLLSNGSGATAAGTATGAVARRTHALLTAPLRHGRPRTLLLRLDERLRAADTGADLACALGADGHPNRTGHLLLESFALDPLPTWRWRVGGVTLERSLFLVPGHGAVAVRYRHLGGPDAVLTVAPLVVARAPGAVGTDDDAPLGAPAGVPGRVRVALPGEEGTLTLWHSGAFLPARARQRVDYPLDGGLSETARVPGYVECLLAAGGGAQLVFSAEEDLFRVLAREGRLGTPPPRSLGACVAALELVERDERASWRRTALEGGNVTAQQAARSHAGTAGTPGTFADDAPLLDEDDGWTAPLAGWLRASLARRGHRLAAVATLPAAEEHGTAALRAVPALVALRAFDPAHELLCGYCEYLDEGLAPESFDAADGRPRYGDPAPALWLVHAAELYARRSGDSGFATRTLIPAVESVLQFYRSGTRRGVGLDGAGLLACGPSADKRVGLNAQWYHALVAASQLARLGGRREHAAFYLAWARAHQQHFLERFWDDARGALYDRIERAERWAVLTPEQLLAVSLAPALLPQELAARMVGNVERELFTPFGLRDHPGAIRVRPEWLGTFYTAYLRVHAWSPESQARVRGWLAELARRAPVAPGALPEWFVLDGDPATAVPEPGGEPVSLLAVASLLRAWVEEIAHTGTGARVVHAH